LRQGDWHFYDWRELIYQMASDYYKYGALTDFRYKIYTNNIVMENGK
jgi:hypothetical protein